MESNKEKDYIANMTVGSLVAFRVLQEDEKLISGKIEEIRDKAVIIQTKNGTNYTIPKNHIAWVNTNGRWPKGVMDAFKISRVEVEEGELNGEVGN